MNTKIRSYAHNPSSFNNGYGKYYMEILDTKSSDRYPECIGTISWQSNPDSPEDYYGMSYSVQGGGYEFFKLKKMAKLMEFIQENKDGEKPEEIKALIGAEEHFFFEGRMIPVSNVGYKFYRILTSNDQYYTSLIAPSDSLAQRKFDLMTKESRIPQGCSFKFEKLVEYQKVG